MGGVAMAVCQGSGACCHCCAELKEWLAGLEAIALHQKGNRTLSVTITGQVNTMLIWGPSLGPVDTEHQERLRRPRDP
jgi:hypothetical protein